MEKIKHKCNYNNGHLLNINKTIKYVQQFYLATTLVNTFKVTKSLIDNYKFYQICNDKYTEVVSFDKDAE